MMKDNLIGLKIILIDVCFTVNMGNHISKEVDNMTTKQQNKHEDILEKIKNILNSEKTNGTKKR